MISLTKPTLNFTVGDEGENVRQLERMRTNSFLKDVSQTFCQQTKDPACRKGERKTRLWFHFSEEVRFKGSICFRLARFIRYVGRILNVVSTAMKIVNYSSGWNEQREIPNYLFRDNTRCRTVFRRVEEQDCWGGNFTVNENSMKTNVLNAEQKQSKLYATNWRNKRIWTQNVVLVFQRVEEQDFWGKFNAVVENTHTTVVTQHWLKKRKELRHKMYCLSKSLRIGLPLKVNFTVDENKKKKAFTNLRRIILILCQAHFKTEKRIEKQDILLSFKELKNGIFVKKIPRQMRIHWKQMQL